MKIGWLSTLLLFLLVESVAQTSTTDQAARDKYKICREAFEEGRYLDCFKCSEELKKQMEKSTPRVLSLIVRSGINALPLDFEGMQNVPAEQLMKLNYKNLNKVRSYVLELSAFLDPADSTSMTRQIINEYVSILEMKMENFAEEKEQTPEKAIAFLNSCAEKFKKTELAERINKIDVAFQLLQDTLFIEMKGRSWDDKPKFRSAHVAQMKIPLKEVWIEKKSVQYWPEEIYHSYPFVAPPSIFTTTSTDPNGPVIMSTITTSGNKIFYDKLLARGARDYNRDMKYPYDEFEKYYRDFKPVESPFYLYYFFNSSSREYQEGNYRKRIEDTFSYLIEYFGGGELRKKTEKKSYF